MRISEPTLKALARTITGDNGKSIYRWGPDLIELFNNVGFEDSYGSGFPARWSYAENKLKNLNGTQNLEKLMQIFLDPRNYLEIDYEIDDVILFLNDYLKYDGYEIVFEGNFCTIRSLPTMDGVGEDVKNLIFAADGPKPEIVIEDSVSNNIKIVKYKENCLIYDQPVPIDGLKWKDLVLWWTGENGVEYNPKKSDNEFYLRLAKSLDSEIEEILFLTYYKHFKSILGDNLPALIPQVYLHYDPYTIAQLKGNKNLVRQRMDFLLLLSQGIRIVIELDGKHHYSDGNISSPQKYAEMVSADRDLRLRGYEVYRFGGFEFKDSEANTFLICSFFHELFRKYNILPSEQKF